MLEYNGLLYFQLNNVARYDLEILQFSVNDPNLNVEAYSIRAHDEDESKNSLVTCGGC